MRRRIRNGLRNSGLKARGLLGSVWMLMWRIMSTSRLLLWRLLEELSRDEALIVNAPILRNGWTCQLDFQDCAYYKAYF